MIEKIFLILLLILFLVYFYGISENFLTKTITEEGSKEYWLSQGIQILPNYYFSKEDRTFILSVRNAKENKVKITKILLNGNGEIIPKEVKTGESENFEIKGISCSGKFSFDVKIEYEEYGENGKNETKKKSFIGEIPLIGTC